ncbi:hypothetical protein AEM51_04325 [Bacteroidetes bacterium UKL13-3]|nr:hypothetical protein AEM51_04325 [Bacteroidetes bacterium UKL13-3]HCP94198.1 hypothetical protein [Bacteroidota bacterium]
MPTLHSHTHCQAAQANATTQAWQRVCLSNRTVKPTDNQADEEEHRTDNSTYKKLAVQWLNEALCFVSRSVVADSFRLRNRQLLVAAFQDQKQVFS